MRALLLALLLPGAALAQGAPPPACDALAALVEWGLMDGGEGGDTTELSALVRGGDEALCRARLDGTGHGSGLDDPACLEAFAAFRAEGPPPGEAAPPPLLLERILGGEVERCEALLAAYG